MKKTRYFGAVLFCVAIFSVLLFTDNTESESIDLFLEGNLALNTGNLNPDSPSSSSRNKACNNAEDQEYPNATNGEYKYYDIASWESNFAYDKGVLFTGEEGSFDIWVSSSKVDEFRLRAIIYIYINNGYTELATVEIEETAPPGGSLEGEYLISGTFYVNPEVIPDDYESISRLGIELESSITWTNTTWSGEANPREASVLWDSSSLNSKMQVDISYMFFEIDSMENERVDDFGEDNLQLSFFIHNSFGASYTDAESGAISISDFSSPSFRNSFDAKSSGSSRTILSANWYYQDDNAPEKNYTLVITAEDSISNKDWSFVTNYYLLVDIFSVDITSEDDERTFVMNPGSEISFDVSVINNGNSFDIVDLETDSSSSGWNIDVDGSRTIELDQGDSEIISIFVSSPSSASGGESTTITISVISGGNPSETADIDYSLSVRETGIQVTPSTFPNSIPINPYNLENNLFHYPFSVKNTGNGADTYSFSTSVGGGWSISVYDVSGGSYTDLLTIDEDQTANLEIVIDIKNAEHDDSASFYLKVISSNSNGRVFFEAADSSFVIQIPPEEIVNLAISSQDISLNPSPPVQGLPLEFTVTIHNTGGKSSGSFQVQLFFGARVEDTQLVSGISGFSETEVILTWAIPSAGTQSLQIKVDTGFNIDEGPFEDDNSLIYTVEIMENPNPNPDSDDSFTPSVSLTTAIPFVLLGLVVAAIVFRYTIMRR